jgi:hypothetical protein
VGVSQTSDGANVIQSTTTFMTPLNDNAVTVRWSFQWSTLGFTQATQSNKYYLVVSSTDESAFGVQYVSGHPFTCRAEPFHMTYGVLNTVKWGNIGIQECRIQLENVLCTTQCENNLSNNNHACPNGIKRSSILKPRRHFHPGKMISVLEQANTKVKWYIYVSNAGYTDPKKDYGGFSSGYWDTVAHVSGLASTLAIVQEKKFNQSYDFIQRKNPDINSKTNNVIWYVKYDPLSPLNTCLSFNPTVGVGVVIDSDCRFDQGDNGIMYQPSSTLE